MGPNDPLHSYFDILEGRARPRFREMKEASEGALAKKTREAKDLSSPCRLCENRCMVSRSQEVPGRCGVRQTRISTNFVHYGEERPLVPSFTIFFSGCNLACVYCQNWDISTRPDRGTPIPPDHMAAIIDAHPPFDRASDDMGGIRNVNWVGGDPIPHLPYVIEVMDHMQSDHPQVWNSNMYMTEEALDVLDGTIDVFLTDLKYGNDICARRLSKVDGYWDVVTRNHRISSKRSELIIRHLMLPGHWECCTLPILRWISDNVPNSAVNIMDQFRPEHLSYRYEELRRGIASREHRRAMETGKQLGLCLI